MNDPLKYIDPVLGEAGALVGSTKLPVTVSDPVTSTIPLFCTYKLLPLVRYNDELFAVINVATTLPVVMVNDPVIAWLPLN